MFEDLISRIDYFTKSIDFLLKDNPWINKKHQYFKTGKCEHCGKYSDNLQYAHRNPKFQDFPEDIKSSSRGKNRRVLHFIKYPNKYYLLDPKCHKKYEDGYEGKKPEGFNINFDAEKRNHLNEMKVKRDLRELNKKNRLPKSGG